MPVFEYKGYLKSGKKASGTIEAETPGQAREKLLEKNIYPYSLDNIRVAEKTGKGFTLPVLSKISLKQLLNFTDTLEKLLYTGFTVHDSLKSIADQMDGKKIKNVVLGLEQDVAAGMHLSEAMKNFPEMFSEFYISLIETGEISGELEMAVSRLREHLDHRIDLKSKLVNNLTYPGLMVVLGISVVIFLFTKVLPVIVKMLNKMHVALPLPTRILIALVEFVRDYGLLFLACILLLIILFRILLRKPALKHAYHRFLLRVPVIGKIQILVEMERFSNVLATMLKSGIPLPNALESSCRVSKNLVIKDSIDRTRIAIIEGTELAKIMRQQGVFPLNMIQFAHAGEKTGTLDRMFARCSTVFQRELDIYSKSLSSLLEPLIILALGIAVGFIAISILLPIFEMNTVVGR